MEGLDYDELYERLDLELLGSKGVEDRFHCPDLFGLHKHGDRSGKFYINREKGVCHCFVCGGMSLAQLVAQLKGVDIDQAKRWLGDFNNDALIGESFMGRLGKLFAPKKAKPESVLPYFNEAILDPWQDWHPFFAERGITEEVRTSFRCGYDKENDAIVFPHFWQERLVGWQRRNLSSMPKYKFSENFPKKETLWGLDRARAMPIIVESVPTALSLISMDYSSIATFGAAVNDQQVTYLRKFTDGIILAPDNDMPGRKWLETLITGLQPYLKVFRIDFIEGEGADIGDLPSEKIKAHIDDTLSLCLGSDYAINL